MSVNELEKICFEFWIGALEFESKYFCDQKCRENPYLLESFQEYFNELSQKYQETNGDEIITYKEVMEKLYP